MKRYFSHPPTDTGATPRQGLSAVSRGNRANPSAGEEKMKAAVLCPRLAEREVHRGKERELMGTYFLI